ncbi:hypothetical protein G9A89_005641 [Geosiphon pyriformis]|nr:hypothetical protein G9A89_005641 [Geosiphon pyriformis]
MEYSNRNYYSTSLDQIALLPLEFTGLDPVFWAVTKLFAQDINKHIEIRSTAFGETFFMGHPIRMVEIIGIIRLIEPGKNYYKYVVDDGTATINCLYWLSKKLPPANFKLGELIRLEGYLDPYKNSINLNVRDISRVNNPNEEILHWFETLLLKKDFFSKPFVIPKDIANNVHQWLSYAQTGNIKKENMQGNQVHTNNEANKLLSLASHSESEMLEVVCREILKILKASNEALSQDTIERELKKKFFESRWQTIQQDTINKCIKILEDVSEIYESDFRNDKPTYKCF